MRDEPSPSLRESCTGCVVLIGVATLVAGVVVRSSAPTLGLVALTVGAVVAVAAVVGWRRGDDRRGRRRGRSTSAR